MGISTSTGTLTTGQSRTFNLSPASAVTLTLSPNVRVTITETPATVAATGLGGNASRVHEPRLPGTFTYGPYPMGGTVVVANASNSGTTITWVRSDALVAESASGAVSLVSGDGNVGRLRAIFDETNIRQGYPLLSAIRSSADHGALATAGGGAAPTAVYETQDGIPVVSLTTQNAGTAGVAQMSTLPFSRVLGNGTVNVLVYCADAEVAKLGNITLFLAEDVGYAAFVAAGKNISTSNLAGYGGWQLIKFHPQSINDGTNDYSGLSADTFQSKWNIGAGSPSWSNAKVVGRLQITPIAKAVPVTVKVAGIWTGDFAVRPPIVFTLDDGYDSHYTTFAPMLERYGLRASFAIIAHAIGTAGYMTEAMLSDLVSRGHEIVVHGPRTGNNLSEYATTSEVQADVAYNQDFVRRFSTNNSHNIYVYPQGISEHSNGDTRIKTALANLGMIGARRTETASAIQVHKNYALSNLMYMPIIGHTWSVSDEVANMAIVLGRMQANADKGQPSIIVNHKIAAVPSNGQEITAANFEVICQKAANLIASGAAINMTLNTMVRGIRALV